MSKRSRASLKKEAARKRQLKMDEELTPKKQRVTANEFEAALMTATVEITAVTEVQKTILAVSYPGTTISPDVTHTWLEIGPMGRQRLHLIEFPESKNEDAVVRLLDVVAREELMIPPVGQFS